MAGIDESIVREYFELHGFLVRQIRKYQVQSRRKLAEEEIDLMVFNPVWERGVRHPGFLIDSAELPFIHRALVVVKGWHSAVRFTPSLLGSPEFLRFLEANVLEKVERLFPVPEEEGGSPAGAEAQEGESRGLLRILVVPGLPVSEPHRSESVRLLREKGVDAVLSFPSMLRDILAKVEPNLNYQKSEILQILRILRVYGMIKDPQLDLFPETR